MSIHHLFLVACCFFWAYLLLCLALKLILDTHTRRHMSKKLQLANDFLRPGQETAARRAAFPALRRACSSWQVLRHLCDGFAALPDSFPAREREELTLFLQQLIRTRVRALRGDSCLSRAVLAWEIRRCRLPSEQLGQFVQQYNALISGR